MLTLPSSATGSVFGLSNFTDSFPLLYWGNNQVNSLYPYYQAQSSLRVDFWAVFNPALPAQNPATRIIAREVVPEPTSLTLALLGIAFLTLVEWSRRRCQAGGSPQAILAAHP